MRDESSRGESISRFPDAERAETFLPGISPLRGYRASASREALPRPLGERIRLRWAKLYVQIQKRAIRTYEDDGDRHRPAAMSAKPVHRVPPYKKSRPGVVVYRRSRAPGATSALAAALLPASRITAARVRAVAAGMLRRPRRLGLRLRLGRLLRARCLLLSHGESVALSAPGVRLDKSARAAQSLRRRRTSP